MPASNNFSSASFKFEILLDIGSHSNSFSYIDGNNLGVEVGDIVSVRLKGRLLNGLAIAKSAYLIIDKSKKSWDFSDWQINFEFLINDQSFMSSLRTGYLQCAKTLCGMFNNPILRKSFDAGK